MTHPLDAVMLTTGKDTRVFEKSIHSALKHLIDIDNFYIITPHADDLITKYSDTLGPRVKFINEGIFPFNGSHVVEIMFESVKQHGKYPMNGNSQFEKAVWSRIGWFLQQILKLYSGYVLKIQDFILLDSDVVWFHDLKFAHNSTSYYYTTSSQYHPAYYSSMRKILNIGLPDQPYHRSGITHHMVIVKSVMDQLFIDVEKHHSGLPLWQVLLNQR